MLGLAHGFIFTFIESILQYWIIDDLLSCKIKGRKRLPVLIAAILTDSLLVQFCPVESPKLRTLLLIGTSLMIVQQLYKDSIFIKIFLVVLTNYVIIISDIMAGNLLSLAYRTGIDCMISEISGLTITFSVFSKMIAVVLVALYIRFFKKLDFNISTKYWVIMDLVVGFFVVVMNFFMMVNRMLQHEGSLYSLLMFRISICFLLMSVLIIYLFGEICLFYQKEQHRYTLDLQNRALEHQLAFQETAASDLKRIRHDIQNNLANIGYLLKENYIEESVKYINAISDTLEATKSVISCGNKYIDSILNYELALCKKMNIDVRFQIDTIPELGIPPTELSSIISNVLNNAIEANLKLAEQDRYLSVKMFCYKNFLSIVVENPYNHTLLEAGGMLKTTKKNKLYHGQGLKSIRTSVQYCGGTFKYSYESNVFTSTIIIPLTKQNVGDALWSSRWQRS